MMFIKKSLLAAMMILATVLSVAWATYASAAITFRGALDLGHTTGGTTYNVSYPQNVVSNLLVVLVLNENGDATTFSVTDNGVPMTLGCSSTVSNSAGLVYSYYILNRPGGSQNLVVTASASVSMSVGAADYAGAASFEACTLTKTTSPTTSTLSTATDGDWVMLATAGYTSPSAGAGDVLRAKDLSTGNAFWGLFDSGSGLTVGSHSFTTSLAIANSINQLAMVFSPAATGPALSASAAAILTVQVAPAGTGNGSGITGVINPNNPVSAASITDGAGAIWSFDKGAGALDSTGDWNITRNGVHNGVGWQLKMVDGNLYHFNMNTDNWYKWDGSTWVSFGQAPPVAASNNNGMQAILEMYRGNTRGDSTPPWLGRVPESLGSLPFGPTQFYSPDGFGVSAGGMPFNVSYDIATCIGVQYCDKSVGTDWAATARGDFDGDAIAQLTQYLLPWAKQIYYVRMNHEWPGNWYQWSPWYGGSPNLPLVTPVAGSPIPYNTGRIDPAVWIAGTRHIIALVRQVLRDGPGGNPNMKIVWEGPYDPVSEQYYPGDDVIDMNGTDDYDQTISQWRFYQNANGGFPSRGYLLTFAQQHNIPSVWPEWCDNNDGTQAPIDGQIITAFANLFASVDGPGKTGIVAHGYWNTNYGVAPGCATSDFPAKEGAYAQHWPNGFYGTHYNRTYWLPLLIPGPGSNPFQ